jgi:hypothetical protein
MTRALRFYGLLLAAVVWFVVTLVGGLSVIAGLIEPNGLTLGWPTSVRIVVGGFALLVGPLVIAVLLGVTRMLLDKAYEL